MTVSGLWDQRSGPAAEADLWKLGLGFVPCPALLRASGPVVFLTLLVLERVPSTQPSLQDSVSSFI